MISEIFPLAINEFDIDNRLKELNMRNRDFFRAAYFKEFAKYKEIAPQLPIDDPFVARLCQILTDNGLTTIDSCQGHPERNRLPAVYFEASSEMALIVAARVLRVESPLKHFPWQISVCAGEITYPVCYLLEPEPNLNIDLDCNHPKLLQDLDYLGLALMNSFSDTAKRFMILGF